MSKPIPHWEHFAHEADMGVRGVGASLAQAFEQAALALSAVIVDPSAITAQESVTIECQAPDSELLLVDWLNALIYEMATRHLLFSQFQITLAGNHLYARASGETVDPARHQPAVEIKGATYTALSVHQRGDGLWVAQCVVDV